MSSRGCGFLFILPVRRGGTRPLKMARTFKAVHYRLPCHAALWAPPLRTISARRSPAHIWQPSQSIVRCKRTLRSKNEPSVPTDSDAITPPRAVKQRTMLGRGRAMLARAVIASPKLLARRKPVSIHSSIVFAGGVLFDTPTPPKFFEPPRNFLQALMVPGRLAGIGDL